MQLSEKIIARFRAVGTKLGNIHKGASEAPESCYQLIADLAEHDEEVLTHHVDACIDQALDAFLAAANVRAPLGKVVSALVYTAYGDEYDREVYIEIHEGETVRIGLNEPHEEGYSHAQHVYTLNEGVLRVEMSSASSDCDGTYTGGCTAYASETVNGGLVWVQEEDWRRDHRAEEAGY